MAFFILAILDELEVSEYLEMSQLIKIGHYGDPPGKGNGKVSRGKDIPACFGKATGIDVVHIIGGRSS